MIDDLTNRLSEPLSLSKGKDRTQIIDAENGDVYGFVADGKITMYNKPSNDNGIQGMYYPMNKIESIRESPQIGYVIVRTVEGNEYHHRKDVKGTYIPRMGDDGEYTIVEDNGYLPPFDPRDKGLTTTERAFVMTFPQWRDFLYLDVNRNRIMMDWSMLDEGEPKIEPYSKDTKSGADLTRIVKRLEEITGKVQIAEGKECEIPYRPDVRHVNRIVTALASSNKKDPFIETIRRARHKEGGMDYADFLMSVGCRSGLNPMEEAKYLQYVSRGIFLTVIQRHMEDNRQRPIPFVPVLIGEQGVGKSTLCSLIGMDWYRATSESVKDGKKFYESVQGSVIVELKESVQFKGSHVIESMKQFADMTELQYRKSYGEDASLTAIMFTMIATTNDMNILRDETGNRRFFPVYMDREDTIGHKHIEDYTREDILDMWAQALRDYRNGARWDTERYEEGMKRIIDHVQSSATVIEDDVLDALKMMDETCPKAGDRITNGQIREYLDNERGYYGKDLDGLVLKVRKASIHQYKPYKSGSVRGLERTKTDQ